MAFVIIITTTVLLFLSNLALASYPTCNHPIIRREWRTLADEEKQSYLSAVKCIMHLPSLNASSSSLTRYDDLVYTHISQTFSIHYVGHFLPWHRYLVATYETMLRDECGYKGAQPYWDWNLDVGNGSSFTSSPVFDPDTGFGGNGAYISGNASNPFEVPGRTGGGCVLDGPFAGIDDVVHLGPQGSLAYNPRCLSRDLSPYFAGRYLRWNQTALTLSQGDYGWFARVVEGGPSFDASGIHGGGHYGVGGTYGEMGDLYNSPSDPLFYLHHANLDRVWWSWQSYDLPTRLKDISGPIYLMDYDNIQGGNVTLDFPMTLGISSPNVTVGDVMNIVGGGGDGIVCYVYDRLY